jgi:alkylation response protein AidB-like acyl-CoA dehydrogenase
MDFTFTEEQRLMAAALRALLERVCAGPQLRALYEGRDAGAEERWRQLTELGLMGVLAGEAAGGLGLGDGDFVLLAEEAGRAALPEPLIEQAAIAVPCLVELAGEPRAAALLEAAGSGRSRIALAHPLNPCAVVPPGVTHWLLSSEDGIYLYAADEVTPLAQRSIDAGRQLASVEVAPDAAHRLAGGAVARAIVARAANRGALYAAAQSLGLTERMLTLAVAYARERVQFGQPIGSYQAIKHQLASVAVRLEFARPVVYAAVAAVASLEPQAQAALSHAKLAAGDAADLAARAAIQVHGAMGYSWEVDLHFYMKRAWALAGAWGDRSFHARRIQSLLCGGAFALGPDEIFNTTPGGSAGERTEG